MRWNSQAPLDPAAYAVAILMEQPGLEAHIREVMTAITKYSLNVLGAFCLRTPDGARITVPSKKGQALIALLAMARDGERSRAWLQEKLWGSRQLDQGRSSLRQELSNLRKLLNGRYGSLLQCEHDRVRLDISQLTVDARSPTDVSSEGIVPAEFLEGLDISGEEGFEEWLREQRAVIAAQAQSRSSDTVADVSQPAPGFGGRPALAVLPFANMTGEPGNEYLAEGIGEELIDRLSRLRWLPVIARSSSFAVEAAADRRGVGRSLGAKYLLEGKLRRIGNEFWLSATLSEADQGVVLWSPRVRLPEQPSPDALEPLATDLVSVLSARIETAEETRAHVHPAGGHSLNELIWKGRWHMNRFTRADAAVARELFAKALAIDPDSSEALIQATWSMVWSLWTQRGSESEILELRNMAQRAIAADPDDSRGYLLAGIGDMWLRRLPQAEALLQRAISLNPSLAHAHAQLGGTYNLMGQPARAVAPLIAAMRLSPNDRHMFYPLGELALAKHMQQEWPDAIRLADQALIRRPAYWYAHMIKIVSLLRSGERAAASAAFDELLRVKPTFDFSYVDWLPFADRTWPDYFIEGLLAASPRARELDHGFQA